MRIKRMILLVASISLMTLWGCSSSMDSDGEAASDSDALANAAAVGINNCLTCHDPDQTLVQEWMASRHGNRLLVAGRLPNDSQEVLSDDPRPSEVSLSDPCRFCHTIDDSDDIDYVFVEQFEPPNTDWSQPDESGVPFIGCEACHGGGQFHYGIPSGIPFPEPTARQCAQCHYLNDELANQQALAEGAVPFHTTSGSGNNVRRNIFDSHIDDPGTTDIIEGYVVADDGNGSCNGCHIAHKFDLTINYQWGNSPHGGHIKAVKDDVLFAGAPDAATLLANVTAAGVDSTTGDAWVHYDWDAQNRQSCQRCHTSTGLMNFLADTANYDNTQNDYSYLDGWSKAADDTVTSSGQNEMLYCWGCHADTQTGELRDDPNGITLDFVNEDPDSISGETEFVVMPDKGKANVCGACHSGRGNNTSIRTGNRSSRFAGHHAPTAGSLYAETTHTGFEYTGQDYTPKSFFLHDMIETNGDSPETGDGPCVGCHMAGSADHTFAAVEEDASGNITAIKNQALCNECHGTGMNPSVLEEEKAGFEEAREILNNYVTNETTNYLDLDITIADNRNTVELNAYGAFQNNLYMFDEPCIYVHNRFYGKRLIFDSIDWLDNGVLNGTLTVPAAYPEARAWLNANSSGVASRP